MVNGRPLELTTLCQMGAEDRRIERKDIASTQFLRQSLMPEGLLDSLSDPQRKDLFAYLMSLK